MSGFLGLDFWVRIPGFGFSGLDFWLLIPLFGFQGLDSMVWIPGTPIQPYALEFIPGSDESCAGIPGLAFLGLES